MFGKDGDGPLDFGEHMARRAARLNFRLNNDLDETLRREAKARGYASPSSFVRASIEHELGGADNLSGAEERLGATIEQARREIARLARAQQALFALVDSLSKVLLTCIPEPPQEVKPQAIARAKERHRRLLKSAGSSMVGDSQGDLLNLVNRDVE